MATEFCISFFGCLEKNFFPVRMTKWEQIEILHVIYPIEWIIFIGSSSSSSHIHIVLFVCMPNQNNRKGNEQLK